MANPYSVNIKGIVDDGTNIYVEMSICTGPTTSPSIFPVFPHGTSAAVIKAYAQGIANAQPTLDAGIGVLVSTIIQGA